MLYVGVNLLRESTADDKIEKHLLQGIYLRSFHGPVFYMSTEPDALTSDSFLHIPRKLLKYSLRSPY